MESGVAADDVEGFVLERENVREASDPASLGHDPATAADQGRVVLEGGESAAGVEQGATVVAAPGSDVEHVAILQLDFVAKARYNACSVYRFAKPGARRLVQQSTEGFAVLGLVVPTRQPSRRSTSPRRPSLLSYARLPISISPRTSPGSAWPEPETPSTSNAAPQASALNCSPQGYIHPQGRLWRAMPTRHTSCSAFPPGLEQELACRSEAAHCASLQSWRRRRASIER